MMNKIQELFYKNMELIISNIENCVSNLFFYLRIEIK